MGQKQKSAATLGMSAVVKGCRTPAVLKGQPRTQAAGVHPVHLDRGHAHAVIEPEPRRSRSVSHVRVNARGGRCDGGPSRRSSPNGPRYTSHSPSLDHRRPSILPLTAVPMAFLSPTRTTMPLRLERHGNTVGRAGPQGSGDIPATPGRSIFRCYEFDSGVGRLRTQR